MKPINKDELRIVFMGTSGSYDVLKSIVDEYPIVGVVDGFKRTKHLTFYDRYCRWNSALRKCCRNRLPYLGTSDINSAETEAFLRNVGCNLLCVYSAHQLLKEKMIEIPKHGVLNAHGAILPDYRGADPAFYIFLNEERMGGVTIHYIDAGEDTGDIIVQEKFEIPFGMSQEQYLKTVDQLIGSCYKRALQMVVDGTVIRIKQGQSKHLPCRNPKRESFLQNYRNWPTERAYHFLNGTNGISQIYQERLYSYAIVGLKKTDSGTGNKFDISCKDGYILVKRQLKSPVRIAKDIVKGVLVRL